MSFTSLKVIGESHDCVGNRTIASEALKASIEIFKELHFNLTLFWAGILPSI